MDLPCRAYVAVPCAAHHVGQESGAAVGCDRYDSVGTEAQKTQCQSVVPAEDLEVRGLVGEDVHDLREVTARFLDTCYSGEFRESEDGLHIDVGAGPSRYVVYDNRDVYGLLDGLVMLIEPFLCGLDVIG